MFKFNSNHIFTGYIKQLLASFNLPSYRVYTGDDEPIVESEIDENTTDNKFPLHVRSIPYIKNNTIQFCTGHKLDSNNNKIVYEWKDTQIGYYYNKKHLNNTKNLEIKNNIYDSYTHEYLGDFLRFQRDYNGIDLMPLYNCFSNRIVQNLLINCDHYYIDDKDKKTKVQYKHFTFDTSDSSYKIYMLPVKMFKKYTIALDCSLPVEICCGIFNAYQDTREQFNEITCLSYKKFPRLSFNKPILYTNLVDNTDWMSKESTLELAQNEQDLKMFIKLPANIKTSITVLEGNYLNWSDFVFNKGKFKPNHAVINFEEDSDLNDRPFKPITSLQLLKLNTKESYPFADRLIEYLVGNTISNEDEISDNIKRVQQVMLENGETTSILGAWEPKMQKVLYSFMYDFENNNIDNVSSACHDVLGYVDKDVENYYKSRRKTSKEPEKYETINTLNDIDIYPDLYKSLK